MPEGHSDSALVALEAQGANAFTSASDDARDCGGRVSAVAAD
jgi:hypothetical protein